MLKDIRAIRLLRIPSMPRLQTRFGIYGVYKIDLHSMNWHTRRSDRDMRNNQQRLYIVSEKPLDKEILPLHDHLYILYPEDINDDPKFLVLRDAKGPLPFFEPRVGPGYFNTEDHETFSLVASVPYTYFGFNYRASIAFGIRMTTSAVAELYLEKLPRLLTVRQLIDDICTFLNLDVAYDFEPRRDSEFFKWPESLDEYFFRESSDSVPHMEAWPLDWNQIFPRGKNPDLLPVYWELANEILNPTAVSDEGLEKCYLSSVHPDFHLVIRNGYVEYSFGTDYYARLGISYHDRPDEVMYNNVETGVYWPEWEWSCKHLAWTKFTKRSSEVVPWPLHEEMVYIRTPLSHVLSILRRGVQTRGMAKCIIWLRDILKTDSLEILRERLAQTHDEFDNLKVEKWDFAIDGDVRIINIC
ncbi:hypothetical protein RRF57_000045 [Xylaria bambusicola]|uniref:Uncharacterized protein n=1 Tax=Xylaria bambusicola TaxID=326684 RepID=A0AAN7UDM4_9PEZI